MNKFETFKAAKDGLDVWPDILRYAAEGTPVDQIPEDDLQRMKWYGVFHRPQKPGTFMMRLRIHGGRVTARQARSVAALAAEFGGGTVDLTTRQSMQLRDIALRDVPEVIRSLQACGLGSGQTGLDNVRNYVGCPLAGLDGLELMDTTPLLAELASVHLGDREFSNLPRKFNLSLAGCREDCGEAQTQDLGFVPATARVAGRLVAGFNVLVGGALGGASPRLATPLDVFVQPHEVVPLFTAILRVYRDHGPREVRTKARLKWLLAEWGEERFRAEVGREAGYELVRAGSDERTRAAGDHLGVHPQRQAGLNYVGLHVPVGRLTPVQLAEAALLAERHGSGDIRLTTGQNMVITSVPDAAIPALLAEPLLRDLEPAPSQLRRGLVACTGIDYCHYSLIDTKTRALELVRELEARGVVAPEGHRMHISGCIHACAKHHVADIGLQGANVRVGEQVVEAVDIFIGGRVGEDARLGARTGGRVTMAELADALEPHLRRVPSAPCKPGYSGPIDDRIAPVLVGTGGKSR